MESEIETLTHLVEHAARHPNVSQVIRRHATGILTHLGMTWEDARTFIDDALRFCATHHWLLSTETILADRLPSCVNESLGEQMKKRGERTFGQFEALLTPGSVLDLGGGSGEIALHVHTPDRFATVADIRDWRANAARTLPFVLIEHNHVPLESASVDTVLLLMVLHHSNDPSALLREAFRVARRNIIVIESVTNSLEEYLYGCWIDWFYNRVLHYVENAEQRTPVPCNFLPATGWEQLAWKLTGLAPTVSRDLGVFQDLNPEHHWLFEWKK